MKHIVATMLCLLAVSTAFAQQTKRMMTVVSKDGTQTTYRVDDVERVRFSERVYDELDNQWALDEQTNAVGSVVMLDQGDRYVFSLYTSSDVTAETESDFDLRVTLPKTLMSQTIDLASDDARDVEVLASGDVRYGKGTLKVKFDKFQKNVTISLDSEHGTDDLRCEYTGAFGKTYSATGHVGVKDGKGTSSVDASILSSFVVKPSSVGGATNFAFGDVAATTPSGMLEGNAAVWVSVSAAKLYNGSVDMASEPESYTFRYIDYDTRTVYEKVQSGTITTAEGYDGRSYISVAATLEDGTQVQVSYYGTPVETESLDEIIPEVVDVNEYKFFNADGDVTLTKALGTSYVDEYNGNVTFYLIPDGDSKYSSDKVVIKVESGLVNAGEIALADVDETKVFDIKYTSGGIQLQSYAAGHGYGNIPNNGTLTVTKDADGVYEIDLDVTNSYRNVYTEKGGDNTRLVLHFKNTCENY